MSWSRLSNDSCAYAKTLNQSVHPLSYYLDPIKYENFGKCRNELGLLGGPNVSHVSGNIVDLENDLRGQTRELSKCPSREHHPTNTNVIKRTNQYKPSHCAIDLTPRHLNTCQMNSYKNVPMPAPFSSSSCYQKL